MVFFFREMPEETDEEVNTGKDIAHYEEYEDLVFLRTNRFGVVCFSAPGSLHQIGNTTRESLLLRFFSPKEVGRPFSDVQPRARGLIPCLDGQEHLPRQPRLLSFLLPWMFSYSGLLEPFPLPITASGALLQFGVFLFLSGTSFSLCDLEGPGKWDTTRFGTRNGKRFFATQS
jgi:hypothetical protein